MCSTSTLGHEVGSSPMATAKPIVFIVDDDAWVRESLETLIQDQGRQPETFASAQEFLDRPRTFTPRTSATGLPRQRSAIDT
jgi:ActR/RegA family two-component response regulator